ncbi:MAG: hypothetical protein KTR31_14285 [Myxococcales bacterium]|nr:hypothetical protein [Myxococcales bacterium]
MWIFALWSCQSAPDTTLLTDPEPTGPSGDPATGWDVLRYGDFVGSGVPAELWDTLMGPDPANVLDRDGPSAQLSASFNRFAAPNGVQVVGGVTCMGCHGGVVEGDFVPGLGNARIDFTPTAGDFLGLLDVAVRSQFGGDSPEYEAYLPFGRGTAAVQPFTDMPFAGVNPAFSIERAAVAHRDPDTLAWLDEPLYEVPSDNIWSDTPPLWHVAKRDSLYWTGFGTGQIPRMLMQISVVGLVDLEQAESIEADFEHVWAWAEALQPPAYPGEVDPALADEGRLVFEATCSGCHGTYGEDAAYIEQIIPLDEIGTDPVYARAFVDNDFVQWVADSWFGSGHAPSPDLLGYVAPPLDGIWATAPYLHNGSVPTLAAVLDPSLRPALWRRDPVDTSLDHEQMGWPYTVPTKPDAWTYDTTVSGADNSGHPFGEPLSPAERTAVLEYLKTL